jgi:type IV pilus assembly protein PilX
MRSEQRGMALITSLLLLIVVTIMGVSMFRSYGIQERIAGNTRDKQRAINAAVSAQQYAETWLSTTAAPVAAVCAGPVSSAIGQVCSNSLAVPSNVPWASYVFYAPFGATNVIDPVNATPDSYFAIPEYYITDLGANANAGSPGEVYQIDAVGYGGTANTVAVVESTYLITTSTAQDKNAL